MDWYVIQTYFQNKLLSLNQQYSVISLNNIALPNKTFNPANKAFWIEYTINSSELIWETEKQRKAYAVINYVLNAKQNTGTERIYNIASKIASLFKEQNGMKWAVDTSGYHINLESLEMLPGIVVNEVFKMNVRLTICVYNV